MALTIFTNIASLNAQRAMTQNSAALMVSFQRLSTGLRINSAKDDSAGLAISERFTAQVRGLNQAARNANDGISLTQTAEGAMKEISSSLQRLRELAVQSANDTNTVTDRMAIQGEADALISEIDRVATQTNFNGQLILDGSFSGMSFQVGANSGQNISVSVSSARASIMGAEASYTSTQNVSATALSAGNILLNGYAVRASVAADDTKSTVQKDASAIAKAAAINASSAQSGVTATVEDATVTGGAIAGGALTAVNYFAINGINIGSTGLTVLANDSNGALRGAINAQLSATGVEATLNGSNQLVLTAADGRNIDVQMFGVGVPVITGLTAAVTRGKVNLSSDDAFTLGESAGGVALDRIGLAAATYSVIAAVNVSTIDLTSQAGADAAIGTLDTALRQVSTQRAGLGAYQNRFESTIANLTSTSENLSAARSRIMDADFAFETAIFSRNQILQQASAAMLAQANISGQIALTLLGR